MKQVALIFCALACTLWGETYAHNYTEGDSMTVVASSGLRMRMSPDMNASTIRILEFGDMVKVVNTHAFVPDHADRIGWMDGHWVKVQYGNLSGYVFDGFLSTLTVPLHENQLCIDCNTVTFPLDRYLADNFAPISIEQGTQHTEEVNQFVTSYHDSIRAIRTSGEGWYQLEAEFQGRRLCEVLNLLRSMMVDRSLRQSFEDSLVFHEDRSGHVKKVEITLYENPITLESTDGTVRLTSIVLTGEDGC